MRKNLQKNITDFTPQYFNNLSMRFETYPENKIAFMFCQEKKDRLQIN